MNKLTAKDTMTAISQPKILIIATVSRGARSA
jgi:hypothetical protein